MEAAMSIAVRRIDDKYEAEVTPLHGEGAWRSPHPMSHGGLIAALLEEGCHPTDVADAMFEADPDWESRNPPTLLVELLFWGGDPGDVKFDQKWDVGDFKAPPATIRYKQAGWKLTSDAAPTATLSDHLERLFLKLAATRLDSVRRPASAVQLSVAIYCHEGNAPELWIPAPMLTALSDLGASVDFDLYSL
jgi:hypothetical protein